MKLQNNSPLVITFSLLCTIAFFVNEYMGGSLTPFISLAGQIDFNNWLHFMNLFSYVLGHSSVDHLLGNMAYILLLGPVLEEKYGGTRLFLMMMATAMITAVLNIVFFDTGLIGASGIVFMFIVLISFTNVQKGRVPITFILIMVLFVGKEILNSINGDDSISQFGHIIGGVIGSLFGFMRNSSSGGRTPAAAPAPAPAPAPSEGEN